MMKFVNLSVVLPPYPEQGARCWLLRRRKDALNDTRPLLTVGRLSQCDAWDYFCSQHRISQRNKQRWDGEDTAELFMGCSAVTGWIAKHLVLKGLSSWALTKLI